MKNQLVVMFFLFLCGQLFAQKNFVIEYDKISENTFYFEKVKGTDRLKPVKAIFPRKGDHVQLIVKNVNPFIYKVKIEVNEEDKTLYTQTENSQLFSMLGTLAGVNLDFLEELSGRDEGASTLNEKLILDIHSELSQIQGQFNNTHSSYQDLIKILKSEVLVVDSIKKKSLDIIDQIENDLPNENSKNKIKQLKAELTKLDATNKEEKSIIVAEIAIADQLVNYSTLSKDDLYTLKELVLNSKTEISKKHTVGYNDNTLNNEESEKSSLEEDKTTNLVFKIHINKVNTLEQISQNENDFLKDDEYIEYYNIKRWKNKNDSISDNYCHGCQPIRLATGYIKSGYDIPLDYSELLTSDNSGAYGIWNIYDKNDSLETSIHLPKFLNNITQRNSEIEETTTDIINVQCQEGNIPKWSSGIFLTNPMAGRSQYAILQSLTMDSLLITEEKTNSLLPSIGATISFQPLTSNLINISYNMGVSVNTFSNVDENKINVLGGIGLSHRDWKYISITAGASLCRTSQLRSIYQANLWYDSSSLNYAKLYKDGFESYSEDVFKLGYYIGVHLNF